MNFKANKHKAAILMMNVKMISWNSELCGWLKAIFVLIKIYIKDLGMNAVYLQSSP